MTLSPLLRDLIRRILVPVQKRLSLDQILEHPWVKVPIEKPIKINKLDLGKMKKATNFSKLKSVVVAFLCAQLPSKDIEHLADQFKAIDTNHDGFISVTEMENALKK